MDTYEKYRKYVNTSFVKAVEPLVLEHADGATIAADDGEEYLDVFSGISVVNTGHGNREVIESAKAQLDKLHLYGDTLSMQTGFQASLVHNGEVLETEVQASDMRISSTRHDAEIHQLNAYLRTDSLSSRLRTDADFFDADLYVRMPFDDLDTLGKGYQDYFRSFRKASQAP